MDRELRERLDAVQQELERMSVELEARRARIAKTVANLEETLRRMRRRAAEYDQAA
jgi:hypothetical protein